MVTLQCMYWFHLPLKTRRGHYNGICSDLVGSLHLQSQLKLMKSIRIAERRELPKPLREIQFLMSSRHLHDSDEEMELQYPLISQDEVTYPSFTVVHDIPGTKTKPPLQLDVNPEGSNLDPTAKEFHPQQVEGEENSNTSQVPSVEADVDILLDETNLPVTEIDLPAHVPVDEGLAVHNTPDNEEPERETDNISLTNQNQRPMLEENKKDNVREEIGLTDTSSPQDEREPETRRPTRTRREPDRLSYKYLGNPLTLVLRSILHSLDQVFTDALDLPNVRSSLPSPYTSPFIDV